HDLKDIVDNPEPAHQRIVKKNIVIEDARYPKNLASDCHDCHSREKQERQQHPAQHCAHFAVEVVRQYPIRNLGRANRTNVLEPISPAKVRMPACSADEGFRNEVSDRKRVGIAVIREGIEFVVRLPMLDPNLLIAHWADQHQVFVEVNVVCQKPSCKASVASKVVIVIADHHGDLDTCAGGAELIENGLVRCNDVIEFFDTVHECQLPESERITNDQQFSVRTFLLQPLQKFNELGGVVAVLERAIAAHVQVA